MRIIVKACGNLLHDMGGSAKNDRGRQTPRKTSRGGDGVIRHFQVNFCPCVFGQEKRDGLVSRFARNQDSRALAGAPPF